MPSEAVKQAVSRLASRNPHRTEADVQADVYVVLTSGGLDIEPEQVARLEVQVGDGTRRRLDVEIGHCVIEVKKDLRVSGVLPDAEAQLAGYVRSQTLRLGTRYVGVLTDGTHWRLYYLESNELQFVADCQLSESSPDVDRLLVWLEAILATQSKVSPSPEEIDRRMGAISPGHQLDHATLAALYKTAKNIPEVALKRDLWAKLLRTAFGKAFADDEDLFIDHTLLVLSSEIIAHAVLGFDVSVTGHLTPAALAQGTAFESAQIHGVVEADFFDWVLHVADGGAFVRNLAQRISRFDWTYVDHDVLKILYESVIPQDDRASLGEYYTPDWLADRIVQSAIADPLKQRVLDPACGSGTFVFHAIRAYLRAADEAGISNGEAVNGVTRHVAGMDIHPVAVILARVTYLLAIGQDRLSAEDRGPIAIPVYLGDSIQWEQRVDLLSGEDVVTISTAGDDLVEGGGALFGDDLIFPKSILHDAGSFDRLVSTMASKAQDESSRKSRDVILPTLRQFGVHDNDLPRLVETFDTMRRLHRTGRDHIWGYYVRNLIRPIWLAEQEHRPDVIIGNPPWLRYSKMTGPMQERYKVLARERGLLSGGLGASGRDLSTLFVARAVELYLKKGGAFHFVMPHGTMTRKPHEGFRTGEWSSDVAGTLRVSFAKSWDLAKVSTGFPMVSCVISGTVTPQHAVRMPDAVDVWVGRLRKVNVQWDVAKDKIAISSGLVSVLTSTSNADEPPPYKKKFRQGAVLAPRVLLFAQEAAMKSPLGAGAGRVAVQSRRTSGEKDPWKQVESLTGTVEKAFYRAVHLGETLLPYRMKAPLRAVLPATGTAILTSAEIDNHAALADWWKEAESKWSDNKSKSDKSDLLDRIDYHKQLSAQLPTARHRVLYTASGNTLAAARLEGDMAVIEHKLYWAPVSSASEARYLTAILNSETVLERVKPLQALGLFGPRDFDKNVFAVRMPLFQDSDPKHLELVELSAAAEVVAESVELDPRIDFKQQRKLVRIAIEQSGLGGDIESLVGQILPLVTVSASTTAVPGDGALGGE